MYLSGGMSWLCRLTPSRRTRTGEEAPVNAGYKRGQRNRLVLLLFPVRLIATNGAR
jgi:hypothetical protein